MHTFNTKKITHFLLLAILAMLIITGAFFLTSYITENEQAQGTVARLGYSGVLFVAVVSGFNTIAPLPPATFVPMFTAAGLLLPMVIVTFIIGTTIADLSGYLFGRWSKDFVIKHYPTTYHYIQKIHIENKLFLFLFVFGYAAVVPFPNEAFIIPFALIGLPLRKFIIPMVLGTTIYHIITAYGMNNLYKFLF